MLFFYFTVSGPITSGKVTFLLLQDECVNAMSSEIKHKASPLPIDYSCPCSHSDKFELTEREMGYCAGVKSAFLPFLREKLNSLARRPSLGTPAFMDNWPIPFSEYMQRTVHHTAV